MKSLTLLTLSLLGSMVFSSHAADVYVGVSLYQLSPDPVNIKSGDIIYWTEADPDFAPYYISGVGPTVEVPYGIQFLAPGSYSYTAQSFYGGQWNGTINVRTNALPSVAVTNPTNNATFAAPASFTFSANASDPDPNDIYAVEFWVGGTLASTDPFTPYSTTVTNLAAGTYTLNAVVRDYGNAHVTNSITITVTNPPAIMLTNAAIASGKFRFNVTGLTIGKTNVLESSTNLVTWTPLSSNAAASTAIAFTNTMSGSPRFFRVVQLP